MKRIQSQLNLLKNYGRYESAPQNFFNFAESFILAYCLLLRNKKLGSP